jgi:hypothetical protein
MTFTLRIRQSRVRNGCQSGAFATTHNWFLLFAVRWECAVGEWFFRNNKVWSWDRISEACKPKFDHRMTAPTKLNPETKVRTEGISSTNQIMRRLRDRYMITHIGSAAHLAKNISVSTSIVTRTDPCIPHDCHTSRRPARLTVWGNGSNPPRSLPSTFNPPQLSSFADNVVITFSSLIGNEICPYFAHFSWWKSVQLPLGIELSCCQLRTAFPERNDESGGFWTWYSLFSPHFSQFHPVLLCQNTFLMLGAFETTYPYPGDTWNTSGSHIIMSFRYAITSTSLGEIECLLKLMGELWLNCWSRGRRYIRDN